MLITGPPVGLVVGEPVPEWVLDPVDVVDAEVEAEVDVELEGPPPVADGVVEADVETGAGVLGELDREAVVVDRAAPAALVLVASTD